MSNTVSIINILWADFLRTRHLRREDLNKISNYVMVYYCIHDLCSPFIRISKGSDVIKHVIFHALKSPLRCTTCGLNFHYRLELMLHQLSKHISSYIGCNQCLLSSTITMDVSKIRATPDVTACPKCGRIYLNGQWLLNHPCRCLFIDDTVRIQPPPPPPPPSSTPVGKCICCPISDNSPPQPSTSTGTTTTQQEVTQRRNEQAAFVEAAKLLKEVGIKLNESKTQVSNEVDVVNVEEEEEIDIGLVKVESDEPVEKRSKSN